jgi:hypothetical protein
VGNRDGAADDEADGERLLELRIAHSFISAPDQVVVDAVVASQYERGHQPEHLLGLDGQSAVSVDLSVKAEEPPDLQVRIVQGDSIQLLTLARETIELCFVQNDLL